MVGKHAAVITASDKGARGERKDESGPIAQKMLEEAGYCVTDCVIVPDDHDKIVSALRRLCDEEHVDLILTTGGTGFSVRDVTPEATLAVMERQTPGIAEAIRQYSLQFTKRAMLSRGVAGIRGCTLIINLPGSPKAVSESLSYILDTLQHGLDILSGESRECGGHIVTV